MSTIRCPHCGTANRVGSNFCNRCGVDLRDSNPENGAPDEFDQTPAVTPSATPTPDLNQPLRSERPFVPGQPDADFVWDESSAASPFLDEGILPDEGPIAGSDRPPRLVSGLQGLLEPVRLTRIGGEEPVGMLPPSPDALTLTQSDRLRRVRDLVAQDPLLVDGLPGIAPGLPLRLRLPWLIVLLLLAVALPILLLFTAPVGKPQQWPGVAEAYAAIEEVQPDAPVWILWAYDPATAGELDLVALPMAIHLLERQGRPVIVSLLPNGLASAQRLFAQALDELSTARPARNQSLGADSYLEGAYLPGGAAALTLLAQAPQSALIGHTDRTAFLLGPLVTQRPALAIVVAAQAEDVQQWLEQVQPLAPAPVVAFTGAGADPILRPYLASGQLQGLVSGFDGAASYQQLRARPLNYTLNYAGDGRWLQQLVAQNWGHVALLLILLLGNLRGLLWGGSHE